MRLIHEIYSHDTTNPLIPHEAEISERFDVSQIQASMAWRMLFIAKDLADKIIDAQGGIDVKALIEAQEKVRENCYSLGPQRAQEAEGMEHILRCLTALHANPEIGSVLKRIHAPHGGAEPFIRRSLLHPHKKPLTDRDARQAALSAWLTPLRQYVGSCFATAPAIIIQATSPLAFFSDLGQLCALGGLKRICEGHEYIVPLTPHVGRGNLLFPVSLTHFDTLGASPGLVAAFVHCGLLPKEATSCQELLVATHSDLPFAVITADMLIQNVLRKVHDVTIEEIAQFENTQRHQQRLVSGMMTPPERSKKGKACAAYLEAYQLAQEGFVAKTEHPLLKGWEFTLASFAEVKADTSRWNLYISLGCDPKHPYGIGALLHALIQEKLAGLNDEIAAEQSCYDHTFAHVQALEGRLGHAENEGQVRYLQAEYRMQRAELDLALARRDAAYDKGRRLASALPLFTSFYLEKFPTYFQEVYDASLREVAPALYDDMPAGFRLLYKHGRTHTTTWTLLYDAEEYLHALGDFFTATEHELLQRTDAEGLEKEYMALTTELILAIKNPLFLEYSLRRLAHHFGEPLVAQPLEHLEQVSRKPWAYLSGGTMATLVSAYHASATPPREVHRWIDSAEELLIFYLDTLKELPLSLQKQLLEKPHGGLLTYSPTHAFILKPAWAPFRKGWENQEYTYSWVRDHWAEPARAFWEAQAIRSEEHTQILAQFIQFLPSGYHAVVQQTLRDPCSFPISIMAWRQRILELLSYEKWLRPVLPKVEVHLDGLLHATLPYTAANTLSTLLPKIWNHMDSVSHALEEKLLSIYQTQELPLPPFLSPSEVQELAQSLLRKALGKTHFPVCYTKELIAAMRHLKIRPPSPILCADTNWLGKTFGFVINPGTQEWDFWAFDNCGIEGQALSEWKPYLDGRDHKEWGIYTAL